MKFWVQVYSVREYHGEEIDGTFKVEVEAESREDVEKVFKEQCSESGCGEACEVYNIWDYGDTRSAIKA